MHSIGRAPGLRESAGLCCTGLRIRDEKGLTKMAANHWRAAREALSVATDLAMVETLSQA
jgi:hypothetical protein